MVFFCQAGIAAEFLVTRYTFWKNTPIAAFHILDNDLKTRTLELAQVDKEYYFDHIRMLAFFEIILIWAARKRATIFPVGPLARSN